jgi:hypothetical protein
MAEDRERDKRWPGNLAIAGLSSPGGGSDRNYDWRIDAARRKAEEREDRDARKKGSGIAKRNERTWANGSTLSRKPSRRSGPIKRALRSPALGLPSFSFSLVAGHMPSESRSIAFRVVSIFQHGRFYRTIDPSAVLPSQLRNPSRSVVVNLAKASTRFNEPHESEKEGKKLYQAFNDQ